MKVISAYHVVEGFENPIEMDNLTEGGDIYSNDNIGFVIESSDNTMQSKERQLYNTYELLNYQNPAVLEIGYDILKALQDQEKDDYDVSRTGENEILIFRKINGGYRNIIIDKDGDVEYLDIPFNRENTYNEHYPFIMGINAQTLAAKL